MSTRDLRSTPAHTWYRVSTTTSGTQLWCALCGRPAGLCSLFLASAFGRRSA